MSPVRPLYHELEERPVVISQKFLVEEAEHLQRRKRWVVLSHCSKKNWQPPASLYPEVAAVMPWAGYTSLRCPGQLCWQLYTWLVCWAAQRLPKSVWAMNVFCLCCAGTSDPDVKEQLLPCHPLAIGMCIYQPRSPAAK